MANKCDSEGVEDMNCNVGNKHQEDLATAMYRDSIVVQLEVVDRYGP